MKIKELLSISEHRPWEMPNSPWKFYQEWNNAIFFHWQVDLVVLKEFVPDEIEIELFEGNPWVSMVAFTMEKMRPKNFPSLPPISDFDEINIRTYVKYKGKSGVYFLSIEGGTDISCRLAKSISELPYRYSKMTRNKNCFQSNNSNYGDNLNVRFEIGNELTKKEPIDIWLTERYALFQETEKSINAFEIHHVEWPINEINIEKLYLNYTRFDKLINNNPNKIQYSKGVEVIAWNKVKTRKTGYNKV